MRITRMLGTAALAERNSAKTIWDLMTLLAHIFLPSELIKKKKKSAQSRQNLRSSLIQAVSQEYLKTESQIPGPSEWLGMRS